MTRIVAYGAAVRGRDPSRWPPPPSGRSAIPWRALWPGSRASAGSDPPTRPATSETRRTRPGGARRRRARLGRQPALHGVSTTSRSRASTETRRAAHAVGASPTFVAVDGRLAAMLVLQDQLRDDAPEAVQALRARQMRNVIMLSGDHAEPSRVIAEALGLRPSLRRSAPRGQGAPHRGSSRPRAASWRWWATASTTRWRCARRDVGIAVPGGAEVATEAADVVLLREASTRSCRRSICPARASRDPPHARDRGAGQSGRRRPRLVRSRPAGHEHPAQPRDHGGRGAREHDPRPGADPCDLGTEYSPFPRAEKNVGSPSCRCHTRFVP